MSGTGRIKLKEVRQELLHGDWRENRRCVDIPTETFFEIFEQSDAEERDAILEICETCKVRSSCLEYGKATKSTGVFGGQYLVSGKKIKSPLHSYLSVH